ncbi:hypothetical protein AgCh_029540 [Apium graveolens]
MAPFRNGSIVISGNESDIEFWPIEHPTEPLDEDRPVKCPVLNSILNDSDSASYKSTCTKHAQNESLQYESFSDNLKKRAEPQSQEQQRVIAPAAEAPILKTLRKRHHTQTSVEEHTCNPFLRMPPRDVIMYNMLQHFDKV